MDIEATVDRATRHHGEFADKITFWVTLTNLGDGVRINHMALYYQDPIGAIPNNCADIVRLKADMTKEVKLCFAVGHDVEPKALAFVVAATTDYGFGVTNKVHVLPFDSNQCGEGFAGNTGCQAIQRINVRDIYPEPEMCVESPMLPTVGTAVYHPVFRDIILTFDTPVWFAEDWRENMAILFKNDTSIITVDGLDHTTRNLVYGNSTFAWLSLAWTDYTNFELDDSHVAEMTLSIDPGTIMYGNGQTLDTRLNVPVELVP